MRYFSHQAPSDTDLWAYAYSTNNSEKSMALKKEPVLGQIKGEGYYRMFHEYKRDGQLKKSSVKAHSRRYADTEQEAIEGYNKLVNNQIQKLEELIAEYTKDIIR